MSVLKERKAGDIFKLNPKETVWISRGSYETPSLTMIFRLRIASINQAEHLNRKKQFVK